MNVYIGTSGELKNAYIGEVYEYSYDFRNKTLSQIQSDGWTYWWSATPTINSWWITIPSDSNESWSKLYCSPSWLTSALSTANKITMNMYFYQWTTSSNSSDGVFYLAWPSSYTTNGTWMGWWIINNYEIFSRILWADLYRWIYTVSSWEYVQTIVIDFINKNMRMVLGSIMDVTRTITDSQIATIKTLKYLRVWAKNNKVVRKINILVE